MAVIFIFIDGIGLGEENEYNPFFLDNYEGFEFLTGNKFSKKAPPISANNHVFKGIDATLGIEGLPQSGTGQTTLFTGINAAKEIGKHHGPYPHSGIKHLLKEQSIFNAVLEKGKKPYFINAYPPVFFEMSEKRNRWSCCSLMVKSAGIPLNSTQEILEEKALTAEIVQNIWREKLGIEIPKIDAEEAAKRLLNVSKRYDFVLYEYYLTDKAGHSKNLTNARKVLTTLNEFLLHIIKHKKANDVLVITSDHGNLEDLSVKTHTLNKVPLWVMGNYVQPFEKIQSLIDIKKYILQLL